MRYHIIVTGSRPEKNSQGHYLPLPEANVQFINSTIAKVAPEDTIALYHGAARGVDTVAEDYAFVNGIRTKQFPAYWFDPTKDGNVNKGAGLFRNEQMVRSTIDNATDREASKEANRTVYTSDETVVLLAFYNTATLQDSRGTAHCYGFAQKRGVEVHAFQLPVQVNSTEPVTNPATSASPFADH